MAALGHGAGRRPATAPARGAAGAFARRLARIPRPLAALLLLAAIEVLCWTIVSAPLSGPDETNHAGYVQYLAETGHMPRPDQRVNGYTYSTEQGLAMRDAGLTPLVGVAAARPYWSGIDQRAWARAEAHMPSAYRRDGSGPNATAVNPPLYYAYESIPYLATSHYGIFDRLFAMRLWSALLYLATIVLVWKIAAELFAREWQRTAMTGTVALLPQLAFLGGLINPDTLLITVWTAFLLLAVRSLKHGLSARRALGVGLVCAASVMTHGRGLAIIPPAVVLVAIALFTQRPRPRRALLAAALALLPLAAAGAIAFVVTTSGSAGAFGGQLGQATGSANGAAHGFNVRELLSYLWQFYLPRLPFMSPSVRPGFGFRDVYVTTFYGDFGALEVPFANAVYSALEALTAAGLLALAVLAVASRRALRRTWPLAATLAVTVLSLLAVLHISDFRALALGDPAVMVGRYLLPLVALFGAGIATLAGRLGRRAGPIFAALVLGGGVLLMVGGLGMSLARFYA